MQSRMDKYNTTETSFKSRTQKNKDLYNDVKNSSLTNFDVNSNISVIDTNANNIDVNELSHLLDQRYSEFTPKRKSGNKKRAPRIRENRFVGKTAIGG